MKKQVFLLVALVWGILTVSPSQAFARVNVFACEPEWAALAEEIGGEWVKVTTATTAQQDVHHIRAKPSLLAAMRKADLVFCSGASLEIGWLPILIRKAGGPHVQQGEDGWLMASDYVALLEVLGHVDRSMGHIHPEGNPHVHLSPNNISAIADVLAERLTLIDDIHETYYEQRRAAFQGKWKDLRSRWKTQINPLHGKKVVVYHNAWSYMLEWLGMDVIASLEPKPGISPTAAHLEKVLKQVNSEKVHAILVGPFEKDKPAKWLSEKTQIPIKYLPFTVGGNEQAKDLEQLFSETIRLMKEDL